MWLFKHSGTWAGQISSELTGSVLDLPGRQTFVTCSFTSILLVFWELPELFLECFDDSVINTCDQCLSSIYLVRCFVTDMHYFNIYL